MFVQPPPRPWQRVGWLLVWIVAGYGVGLSNGFTFDDFPYLEQNSHLRSWSGLWYLFAHPVQEGETLRALLYRPLAALIQGGIGQSFGFEPLPYHLANLLLYAALALLLYQWSARFVGPAAAWLAALFFVVHPIHTEAVASAVGMTELLAALFMVSAWLVADPAPPISSPASQPGTSPPQPLGWQRLLATGTLFLAALLCKETVILLPAVAFWGAWQRGRRGRDLVQLGGVAGVAVALYFGLRHQVVGAFFSSPLVSLSPLDNPLVQLPADQRITNGLFLLGRSLGLLVWPANLSADYSLGSLPIVKGVLPTLASGLLHACLLGLAWKTRRRWPGLAVGCVIFYLGLLPTSNLLLASGTHFAERFLLLPALVLLLPLAEFLVAQQGAGRRWASVVAMALLVAGTAVTFQRVRDWRDDATLFRATLAAYPQNAKANYNVAILARREGDERLARTLAERAVEIYPSYGDARVLAAQLASAAGDPARALTLLEAGTRAMPGHEQLWVQLGQFHLGRGDLGAAARAFAAGAAALPDSWVLPYNQAMVALEMRQPKVAEPLLRRVLAATDLPDAHYALGHLLLQARNWPAAETAFARAANSQTWGDAALWYRALARVEMGQAAAALELLGTPESAEAMLVAALAHRALGNGAIAADLVAQLGLQQPSDCPLPDSPLFPACQQLLTERPNFPTRTP